MDYLTQLKIVHSDIEHLNKCLWEISYSPQYYQYKEVSYNIVKSMLDDLYQRYRFLSEQLRMNIIKKQYSHIFE